MYAIVLMSTKVFILSSRKKIFGVLLIFFIYLRANIWCIAVFEFK